MNRRLLLILLALTATLGIDAARADDGKDGGGDHGSDDGGSDESGGDDDGGDDRDGGDDSEDDSGDDGGNDGGSDHSGGGGSGGTSGTGNGSSTGSSGNSGSSGKSNDHDQARDAVAGAGAMPLKQLLALFRDRHEGEVVDVTLIRRQGVLVYRVKFIDTGGRVRRAEFNARSGESLS